MLKKLVCILVSLTLLVASPVFATQEGVQEEEASLGAEYEHDGHVTFYDGALTQSPIWDFSDAEEVILSYLSRLGGGESTTLVPWRTLSDAFGNQYYVFQQMYDNTTVLGGAVKVITDGEGQMIGLTSSIKEVPEGNEPSEGIDEAEAEEIVRRDALERQEKVVHVLSGMTSQMILPVAMEVDLEAEEEEAEKSRYVWVVYTDNPDGDIAQSSDLPYLAHYVTFDGEYLYSLPTIMPGDEAGSSGFSSSYVFEFMESINYTGYVDLSTGEEMEISVDVMRDTRTGMYYLGNLERRIVVADCYEFLYNEGRVVLASSPDNLYWDQVGLLTLYNYCRAYDYYKEIGWIGGDGLVTPILVLNDYCDENHKPVDNAAYVGGYLGWQIFLASQANDFSQCLDVLAHEFTHCVTGSVMTFTAYKNDFGAINEAMSDIQGKTCQMLLEGKENVSWVLGDKSLSAVRDMADPHHFSQPEYSWDLYYRPQVKTPTLLNDLGGVHNNSSLLNRLAYLLYEDGGMTLEEGRAFWFTVDCAMVPGTDFLQLSELLPWALKASGLEKKYGETLQSALEATKLGIADIPTSFEENKALLTLHLPDNEVFEDEQWIMMTYGVNPEIIAKKVMDIVFHLMRGDYSILPESLRQMMEKEEERQKNIEEKGFWGAIGDALQEAFAKDQEESKEEFEPSVLSEELSLWFSDYFKDAIVSASANAGQDGHTMRTILNTGYTISLLLHGIINQSTSMLEDTNILFFLGNRWYDLTAMMEEPEEQGEMNPYQQKLLDQVLEGIQGAKSFEEMAEFLLYHVEGGKANELPANGLEDIQPLVSGLFDEAFTMGEAIEPRMSRPKLSETEAAEETEVVEEPVEAEEIEAAA